MDNLTYGYLIVAMLVSGYGWALSKRPRSVIGMAVVLISVYLTFISFLSYPKPFKYEFSDFDKAKVVAYSLDEPTAIYIWVLLPGSREPRAYVLPWSEKRASNLQHGFESTKEGKADGVVIDKKKDKSGTKSKRLFYPKPQPSLPSKEY